MCQNKDPKYSSKSTKEKEKKLLQDQVKLQTSTCNLRELCLVECWQTSCESGLYLIHNNVTLLTSYRKLLLKVIAAKDVFCKLLNATDAVHPHNAPAIWLRICQMSNIPCFVVHLRLYLSMFKMWKDQMTF